jgi:AcrR family transcriptional regulator
VILRVARGAAGAARFGVTNRGRSPDRRVPIPTRKPVRQRRATVTRDAMIIAAERVLERDGVAGLTTNRVAEVAGVSIGSLYQYFPNKEAIVAVLIERYVGAFAGSVIAAIERERHAPMPAVIAAVVRAMLSAFRARPRIHAELRALRAAAGQLETVDRVVDDVAAAAATLVRGWRPAHARPEVTAFVIVHAVYGAIEAYAVRRSGFDLEALGDELAAMVGAYLR